MKFKIIIFLFLGVVGLYIVIAIVSETNWSCASCHSQNHQSWLVSTHQTVNCRQCHINPGIEGALDAQWQGIKDLYVSITKGNEIPSHVDPIPISSKNCRDCHSAILYFNEIGWEDLPENSLKRQGFIMAHYLHINKYFLECVDCHRGIVHRNPKKIDKYVTNWPFTKNDCGPCHDGQFSDRFQINISDLEDKQNCIICHPAYTPPPDYEEEY